MTGKPRRGARRRTPLRGVTPRPKDVPALFDKSVAQRRPYIGRMKLKRIGTVHCDVGEGPLWDAMDQSLYFVDVTAAVLWRYDPARETFARWKMQSMIGSLALRENGGAVLALQDGFHRFSFHNNTTAPICKPRIDERAHFSAGKVDRRGRFVAATAPRSPQETAPPGRLYALDENHQARQLDEGFGNGLCWSPDGRTFYFSDGLAKTIYVYDYDLDTGAMSNRRVFADTTAFGGSPEGTTVDSAGRVWVAIRGGAKIVCFDPDGSVVRVVDVPVPLVSSVMFGGPSLDRLYFTSIDGAAVGAGPRDAQSGGLFVIEGLGVRGVSEPRYAG
jgi:sugar lactone lactonase YvrE